MRQDVAMSNLFLYLGSKNNDPSARTQLAQYVELRNSNRKDVGSNSTMGNTFILQLSLALRSSQFEQIHTNKTNNDIHIASTLF